MSSISSSRMPHAYAAPEQQAGTRDVARRADGAPEPAAGRGRARNAWLLAALGISTAGAAVFATLRSRANRGHAGKRKAGGRQRGARRAKSKA